MSIKQCLVDSWYRPTALRWLLSPLSGLYRLITYLRRFAYQQGWFKSHQLSVPVIIVGNITVGGSGKTPLVIALAETLKQAGLKPGIISRGYGGNSPHYPLLITTETDTRHSGDEPKLIALRTGCPVVIDPNRPQAGQFLLENHPCDILIADDGLQHYALQREIEIAVVDGKRGFGNGFCLPAGPLREPRSRLNQVHFIVWQGGAENITPYTFELVLKAARQLTTGTLLPLSQWSGKTVHAVAGIGHPQRFFEQLRQHSITVIEHAFADHHVYSAADLQFTENYPILMTEKDAVKCQLFASPKYWAVPATANLSAQLVADICHTLRIRHE